MAPSPEENFRRFALAGDLAALGQVFDALASELHGVARRLAPASPTESAEDLVQATFLTAIEKAADYDGRRPVAAWLVGILALHAKNARRKVSRRGTMASLDAGSGDPLDAVGGRPRGAPEPRAKVADPAEAVVAADWIASVRRAVAATPHSYRPVLEAVLFEGATPAEAALALDLNPGTARQRLSRGLARLRDSLVGSPARGLAGLAAGLAFARRSAAMRETVLAAAAPGGSPSAAASAARTLAQGQRGARTAKAAGSPGLAGAGLIALAGLAALAVWATGDLGPGETGEELAVVLADADRTAPDRSRVTVPIAVAEPVRTAVAAPEPPAARAPARRVEGRVFLEGTGLPVEGAEILLHHDEGTRVLGRSNAEGSFTVDVPRSLMPRENGLLGLDLELRAPGLERWRMPRDPVRREQYLQDSSISTSPRAVSMLVHLMPAFQLAGRVVDAQGNGTPAELFLIGPRGQLVGEDPIGRTDETGAFELEDVGSFFHRQPRPLPLLAVADHGTGFLLAGQDLPGDLTAGEAPPALEELEIVLADLDLSARVVDRQGQPLAGVLVEAKALDHTWNTGAPQAPPHGRRLWEDELPPTFAARFRAVTDHDGRVTFDRLPRVDSPYVGRINDQPMTRWTLHAAADGYLPTTDHDGLVIGGDPQLGDLFGAREVELVLGTPDPLVLSGRVLASDGRPLDCAQLCAQELAAGFLSQHDGTWSFTMPDRAALPERVQAVVDGYVTRTWTITEELAAGLDGVTHDFVMLPPVGLSLLCVDPDGRPLDGVAVSAVGTDPDTGEPLDLGSTTTQLGGWVHYDEAPTGTWTVTVGESLFQAEVDVEPFERQVVVGTDPVELTLEVTPR